MLAAISGFQGKQSPPHWQAGWQAKCCPKWTVLKLACEIWQGHAGNEEREPDESNRRNNHSALPKLSAELNLDQGFGFMYSYPIMANSTTNLGQRKKALSSNISPVMEICLTTGDKCFLFPRSQW